VGRTTGMNPFYSLRTQLCLGAIALLGITVASISYFLIENEKRILTREIQRTIVFQGRNIADGSEKALLRSDPEFELFPLVNRLVSSNIGITSLVVTDANNIVQGANNLQMVSRPFAANVDDYAPLASDLLAPGEAFYERRDAYLLSVPVKSRETTVGFVHMVYSKQELRDSIQDAVSITLMVGLVAFILGIVLALWLFRRISRPMDVLMRGVESLGEGRLETRITMPTRNEFHVLAQSFNTMTTRLADVQRELVEKEITDRELKIAHEIQATLIPHKVLQSEGFEIALYYNAAAQVGGDYVDVFKKDASTIAIVMADVAGKGIPGLVVMAMLRIMVHEYVATSESPKEIIRKLNVSLSRTMQQSMFVTLFIGILDTKSGDLVYSNAGHNPLVVYDGTTQQCEMQTMAGPPLGVFPDESYYPALELYRRKLRPGDVILQYTDGLTESNNENGKQFGRERVARFVREHAASGATELVDSLVSAEARFRGSVQQFDDLTLLAVRAKVPVHPPVTAT
jgi:serine phosphatase RsbU (regulator of sigma subunit)